MIFLNDFPLNDTYLLQVYSFFYRKAFVFDAVFPLSAAAAALFDTVALKEKTTT